MLNTNPINEQRLIWIASYEDETQLQEYDYELNQDNSFYDIKKDELIRFGLMGYGMNLYYEVLGGSYKLSGKMFEFLLRDKNTNQDYYLTGKQQKYNDIIQFKQASSDIDLSLSDQGVLDPEIVSYNFGYKTQIKIDDLSLGFQTILSIPLGNPSFFNFKFTPNKNLDADFIIKKNGEETYSIPAYFEEGYSSELNWELIL